jgi:hypothetical protein
MATETVSASDVKVGDKIHFPNSRHAQEVTEATLDEHGYVTLRASETHWTVPQDWDIRKEELSDAGE